MGEFKTKQKMNYEIVNNYEDILDNDNKNVIKRNSKKYEYTKYNFNTGIVSNFESFDSNYPVKKYESENVKVFNKIDEPISIVKNFTF